MKNGKIYISGVIGEDVTLLDVIRQVKSLKKIDELMVVIDSPGGYMEEGEAIYNYLDSLKSSMRVNTFCKHAYSMAAKIFTVGEERIVEDNPEAIMIHFAWTWTCGGAEEMEKAAEDLNKIKKNLIDFYSKFLNLDEETTEALLESETFLTGEEAVEVGFATELRQTLQAVAMLNINNQKDMKKSKLKEFLNKANSFIRNLLTLQDSSGKEIEFPDLDIGDSPKVGDKATIDNEPIADGEYIIPSMDDKIIVFENGAITEIKEREDDEDIDLEGDLDFEDLVNKVEEKIENKYKDQVSEKEAEISKKDEEIKNLKTEIENKDKEIKSLNSKITSRDLEDENLEDTKKPVVENRAAQIIRAARK